MIGSTIDYRRSLRCLEAWLEQNNYAAYDPFDGLSLFLRIFTFHKKISQKVLQQVVCRNPFNLRPLLGMRHNTSTKGMGFLASGYCKLFQLTGDERYRQQAIR